jgi:hypothetical protein
MNRKRHQDPCSRATLALIWLTLRLVSAGVVAVQAQTPTVLAFTVASETQVTATVPAGVGAGAVAISIVTAGGTAARPTKFTVH